MAYNALTDDATGAVLKWGYSTFTAPAGTTEIALNKGTLPVDNIPLDYNKIVAADFTEMTASEKAVVDSANAKTDKDESKGAATVDRTVNATADLALPPSREGLLLQIRDVGGAVPGMAISTTTGLAVFASDKTIP